MNTLQGKQGTVNQLRSRTGKEQGVGDQQSGLRPPVRAFAPTTLLGGKGPWLCQAKRLLGCSRTREKSEAKNNL
jgi:hypothetical protein